MWLFLTQAGTPADQCGHGTAVAGVAVYGDVRRCLEAKEFSSPITLFSARILNERNELDDERLFVSQVREAVAFFKKQPYNCRVFNLSFGTYFPAARASVPDRFQWAEALDVLAAEEKVLFVVSAGNNSDLFTVQTDHAEEVLKEYPDYLFRSRQRLNDPGVSGIALTVGALAEYEEPSLFNGRADITRAVARQDQPSPFTRTGPGIGDAVKPELVHYGGNLVFAGTGNTRRIHHEPGSAVISLSHEPHLRLFVSQVGTTLAAPRVARTAAITWHRLRQHLEREPSPNLVRAVMAAAAEVPAAASALVDTDTRGEHAHLKVCGYGLVDDDYAMDSSNSHVVLVAEDEIELDKVMVFSIPMPSGIHEVKGAKAVTIAVAYDPPVRRRRADYLGVLLRMDLIRGKTAAEVFEAYGKPADEADDEQVEGAEADDEEAEEQAGPIRAPFRATLTPPGRCKSGVCRNRSTLQCATFDFTQDASEYGDTYLLVIRAVRKWAPTEITHQSFAVAVALSADHDKLYELVRERIAVRPRVRV